MELATAVAAEGSDLAELFARTGKMKQLVTALAADGTALLFSTGPDKGLTRQGRRAKERGWNRELWRVEM
jgi:hypothetical protein